MGNTIASERLCGFGLTNEGLKDGEQRNVKPCWGIRVFEKRSPNTTYGFCKTVYATELDAHEACSYVKQVFEKSELWDLDCTVLPMTFVLKNKAE